MKGETVVQSVFKVNGTLERRQYVQGKQASSKLYFSRSQSIYFNTHLTVIIHSFFTSENNQLKQQLLLVHQQQLHRENYEEQSIWLMPKILLEVVDRQQGHQNLVALQRGINKWGRKRLFRRKNSVKCHRSVIFNR